MPLPPTLRSFLKSPSFTAATILTLAAGIGANTAIFSIANTLLLRPLPYSHPERLTLLSSQRHDGPSLRASFSWPRFQMLAEHQQSFTSIAAVTNETFNLSGAGDPVQLRAARVSWNFFDVLGVRPAAGRWFEPDEDKLGGPNVAVLSASLWRSRFAADPSIAGRHITLDAKDFTVVGVAPDSFQFAPLGTNVEVYAPRVVELNLLTPAQAMNGPMFLDVVARLRDTVTLLQAQAELDALNAQYMQANSKLPDAVPGYRMRVAGMRGEIAAGVRTAVLILMAGVGLVLLIACANVSSLLLSRALGRRREIAIRMAIGASRATLIRQLFAESLLLSFAGGALGAAFSVSGARALAALAGNYLPLTTEISPDVRVLVFTAGICLLTAVLFGLAPAMQISRPDLNTALRSEGRGATAGRSRNLFRQTLVVSQVALSTILLIGAGLLLRNFLQMRAAAPGFDPARLLTMNIMLPSARYSQPARMVAFYDELVRQVRAIPGVRSAAVSSALPLTPARLSPSLPEGQPAVPVGQRPLFNIQAVVSGYVETMRVLLKAGREFTERDDAQAPKVVMVNESVARRYWPGENPIGKHITIGRQPQPGEVIGVLGDIRNAGLAADVSPEIYIPFAQLPWASMHLLVRTEGDPRSFTGAIRARIAALDQDLPVTGIRSMDDVLEAGAAQPKFLTTLIAALAALALGLALVGIYGVISYSVNERTQEMGVRIALGAARDDIFRLVLTQGATLAAAGITLGLAASLLLTQLLKTFLYRVSATDPITFAIAAIAFMAIALVASYIPARRATKVDPVITLRG